VYFGTGSLLSELHWLPVSRRINFKIATLAYQSVAFGQPTYLSSVLTPHQPQWSLQICYLCHAATAVLEKGFSYCTYKIWNDIPRSARAPLPLPAGTMLSGISTFGCLQAPMLSGISTFGIKAS